jgi:hypothetical protein
VLGARRGALRGRHCEPWGALGLHAWETTGAETNVEMGRGSDAPAGMDALGTTEGLEAEKAGGSRGGGSGEASRRGTTWMVAEGAEAKEEKSAG